MDPYRNPWWQSEGELVTVICNELGWSYDQAVKETAGQLRLYIKEHREGAREAEEDSDPFAKIPTGLHSVRLADLQAACQLRQLGTPRANGKSMTKE